MEAVRKGLQKMGASMDVVVQDIYNITDLVNDGQLRKMSAQGSRSSHESAGSAVAVCPTLPPPSSRRLVAKLYRQYRSLLLH